MDKAIQRLESAPSNPNVPYDVSVKIEQEKTGGVRKLLENAGVVMKEYRAKVSVVSKPGDDLNDVKEVKIKLPKQYIEQQQIDLSASKASDGVEVKVWKDFSIEVEVMTNSGQTFKIPKKVVVPLE